MSKIEERIIEKLRTRAAAGKAKYGTTMERDDLTNAEWLQHLQEELLDAAVYIEKLMTMAAQFPGCPIPLDQWPKWANWAAMDGSAQWFFYEEKPQFIQADKSWVGHVGKIDGAYLSAADTLTPRPEPKNQKSK